MKAALGNLLPPGQPPLFRFLEKRDHTTTGVFKIHSQQLRLQLQEDFFQNIHPKQQY